MGADGKVDVGPTHALMALPEDLRVKYCVDVILALAATADGITKLEGKLQQAKAVKKFMADLREKKDEILPVILYTVKPVFREIYLGLLERFEGVL